MTASWSNSGLGCCRYTGIHFSGCTGTNDDKGCFENGSTSASCTGQVNRCAINIYVTGKQNRIIQVWVK